MMGNNWSEARKRTENEIPSSDLLNTEDYKNMTKYSMETSLNYGLPCATGSAIVAYFWRYSMKQKMTFSLLARSSLAGWMVGAMIGLSSYRKKIKNYYVDTYGKDYVAVLKARKEGTNNVEDKYQHVQLAMLLICRRLHMNSR